LLELAAQKWYKQGTEIPLIMRLGRPPASDSFPFRAGFYYQLLIGGPMFKVLAISFVVGLSCLCAQLVVAQPSTRFVNDSRDAGSSARIVSPEAKAEAKRLYKEGVKYGLAGLFPQAAEILQRAVKLDPQFLDAHFALGHAYFDMRQWKNAIGSFERALELSPKDEQARDLLTLARTMAHQGPEPAPRAQRSAPPESVQVSLNVKPMSQPPVSQPPVSQPPVSQPMKAEAVASEPLEVNATADEIALTRIYRVGPGDVLDIRINDSVSQQSTLFTVTPAGVLEHPMLAEPLSAGGLTVDEISAKFEGDLKKRALSDNPKVSIGVRDYASHMILVSGLVKDSGTKILRREAIPLYVVVADAQPLPEAARLTVVRSESKETFEIDLGQASEMNLLVRPGDVITLLPNVTQFVYIGGEVKLPGEKNYRRGLTLTQAIIAAGGVTPKSKEARVGRDDGKGFLVVTRFKLKDIESGKIPDPAIKPGDRIMIHE
jgi:polysaccharide biosynthesis/export protein